MFKYCNRTFFFLIWWAQLLQLFTPRNYSKFYQRAFLRGEIIWVNFQYWEKMLIKRARWIKFNNFFSFSNAGNSNKMWSWLAIGEYSKFSRLPERKLSNHSLVLTQCIERNWWNNRPSMPVSKSLADWTTCLIHRLELRPVVRIY